MRVYDGLAWLMQIVLFLTLGLLVYPSHIIPVLGIGLLISLFLIVIARPLGVFMSLIPFKMKNRRRLYISWVGLRGAVPIVFATYPLLAGIEKADMIFNIVFFISITSVIIQGTTLSVVAKWLHVSLPEKVKPAAPRDTFLNDNPKAIKTEIAINTGYYADGKKVVDLKFPPSTVIAMIKRDNKYLTPNGATVITEGDVLVVLCDREGGIHKIYESLKIPYSHKVT